MQSIRIMTLYARSAVCYDYFNSYSYYAVFVYKLSLLFSALYYENNGAGAQWLCLHIGNEGLERPMYG